MIETSSAVDHTLIYLRNELFPACPTASLVGPFGHLVIVALTPDPITNQVPLVEVEDLQFHKLFTGRTTTG